MLLSVSFPIQATSNFVWDNVMGFRHHAHVAGTSRRPEGQSKKAYEQLVRHIKQQTRASQVVKRWTALEDTDEQECIKGYYDCYQVSH